MDYYHLSSFSMSLFSFVFEKVSLNVILSTLQMKKTDKLRS